MLVILKAMLAIKSWDIERLVTVKPAPKNITPLKWHDGLFDLWILQEILTVRSILKRNLTRLLNECASSTGMGVELQVFYNHSSSK